MKCREESDIKMKKRKQIVLVSTHFLKPRILKIAYALSQEGYEIILFYNKVVNNEFKTENYPYFRKAYGYGYHTQWLCILKMMRFSPLVYHIFSEQRYNEFPRMIVKARKLLGKIVYDEYDMTVDKVINASEHQIRDEKYCIENADGVCSRSFELEYLKEKKKYRVKKDIQFFDYCWNNVEVVSDERELINGFAFAGSVTPEGSRFGFCYEEVAKALNNKKLFYHIYAKIPEPWQKFHYDLEKKIPTYKWMGYVPHEELLRKLSHYLAGIFVFEKNLGNEKENLILNVINYKYATSNRYFDYIDAGLPIIGTAHKRVLDFLSSYGIVYYTSSDELNDDLDDLLKKIPEMRKNIIKCREDLDIGKQISKLSAFYQSLY